MATVPYTYQGQTADPGVVLGTAQTGNVTTTNTLDRGALVGPGAVILTSTVGATPTVTVNIQGSVDNVTFFNIPYALVATPATFVIAAITVTTAVTTVYLLQRDQPWRYVNVVYSANTNCTMPATAYSR